jgi:predicted phage terminase large subunit-like protein
MSMNPERLLNKAVNEAKKLIEERFRARAEWKAGQEQRKVLQGLSGARRGFDTPLRKVIERVGLEAFIESLPVDIAAYARCLFASRTPRPASHLGPLANTLAGWTPQGAEKLLDDWPVYEALPWQERFHTAEETYKLGGGAMGPGKTRAGCEEIYRLALDYPGNRLFICRKEGAARRRTTDQVLFDEVLPPGAVINHNKQEGIVDLAGGSMIIFGDLESTDKIKSLNLGGFFIDEASDCEETDFLILISRLRLSLPGIRRYGLLASNPAPGWLRERFLRKVKPGHIFIQALTRDNPYLHPDYEEELRRQYPEFLRRQLLDGDWDVFDRHGLIFKREWWQFYTEDPPGQKVQSWDTAFKAKEENDFSVCETWIKAKNGYYLKDVFRERLEFPQLVSAAKSLYEREKPGIVLIEDKASGQSLIQSLGQETKIPLKAIKTDRDKTARANAVTPLIEGGRVFLKEGALWVEDFLNEHTDFPFGDFDDQVDATTQALNYLAPQKERVSYKDLFAEDTPTFAQLINRRKAVDITDGHSIFMTKD